MVALRLIDTPQTADQRAGKRNRVLMGASLRIRGGRDVYPINVKDISSTGLRAAAAVPMFVGALVEVDLQNIGWVPGQVVWANRGQIGVNFAAVIEPERTRTKVSGSYGPAPSVSAGQSRRL